MIDVYFPVVATLLLFPLPLLLPLPLPVLRLLDSVLGLLSSDEYPSEEEPKLGLVRAQLLSLAANPTCIPPLLSRSGVSGMLAGPSPRIKPRIALLSMSPVHTTTA